VAAFIAIVVVAVIFVKSHSKLAWQEFRPGEPGLSVMMPGEPTAHEPVVTPIGPGEMKQYLYTSTVLGQGHVNFLMVTYPVNFDRTKFSVDQVLDGELENALKDTNSSLISKSRFDEGEVTGLSFEYKPKSKLVADSDSGFGKLYLTGCRLYALTIEGRKNSELIRSKDKFLKATIPYF
jgi:hypothetical protein